MTKSRTEIGRSSRRKGKVGEREVVNALKAVDLKPPTAAHNIVAIQETPQMLRASLVSILRLSASNV